jgi:prepilin-type processing-associated H-X9-DG protein
VTNVIAYRPQRGANVAYWDGHVEHLRRDEIVATTPLAVMK